MRKLVVSTGNKNKLREIRDLLKGLDIEVLSKDQVGQADFDVVEDGESLEENSRKKALGLFQELGEMVIADDSGLFVDYLDGAPGVHSARYSGLHGDDEANNRKLLKELEGVEYDLRRASFQTVISLVDQEGRVYEARGICPGHIEFEARGRGGFGYDPLFRPDGYDKTFGELDLELKNTISHRYRAIVELRKILEEIL